MAIYHLHVKVLQRSKGKNAVASAAYRQAARLFDEKEGRYWDYTSKPHVIHSELLVPKDAPDWAKALAELHAQNPSKASERLWNDVEAVEKRVDSQLAREVEFSLPLELDSEKNIQLAREFIQDQFVLRGMMADWNVHWDEGNPHVHVMLTMRYLIPEGFGKRALEWNQKDLLREWRERWAEYVNFHLRLHQQDVRIDHRSYEDQGIDLVPSVHQGKAVTDMSRRGISTEIMKAANEVRQENLARISADPKVLLNKMTSQRSSFTTEQLGQELGRYVNDQGRFSAQGPIAAGAGRWDSLEDMEAELHSKESLSPEVISAIFKSIEYHQSAFIERSLAKAIQPFTENAEQFAQALLQIKASAELMYLGPGEDGRDRFTTRTMFGLENELQHLADLMRSQGHVSISDKHMQKTLNLYQVQTHKTITDEQRFAIKYILKPSSISCLVGRAGTGKSFSLGAARAVWESVGLRVHGIALSGIAADGLIKDAAINSRTIESFRFALEQGTLLLGHHDVIVMDEAGMTDSVSMLAVLRAAFEARAKLVLVGDHGQLQPVGPGATFRALVERLGCAELQIVYRQNEPWQREATLAFSAGDVAAGLSFYEEQECIHLERNDSDALSQLVADWVKTRHEHPKGLSEFLVLAHRNEDVVALNHYLRQERVQAGELAEGYVVQGKLGEMRIAQGDRILFLKNKRSLGISNGRFATITSVDFTELGRVISFRVELDGSKQSVQIHPEVYNHFVHGYASTIHKAQGMTVDHSFVYAGGMSWNRHLTYVAMTRHRLSCHLYASKEMHRDLALLKKQLGRMGLKDSVLDFPLAFAERRGIDTEGLLSLLPAHLAKRLKTWTENLSDRISQARDPEWYAKRQADVERELKKTKETTLRREDARLVAAYADCHQETGMAWQVLQSKLTALGLSEMSYEAEAYALISGTHEYKALQLALSARDKNAYAIMQNPARYEKAIQRYSFDLTKLQTEADRYARYERVQHYIKTQQEGKVVYRDRLAAEIMQDIKKHYASLKGAGLDSRVIKADAVAHLRRQYFITLTPEERAGFKVVEAYQSYAQQLGAAWSQTIASPKKPIKHILLDRLAVLAEQRDSLAYQIMQDREQYAKALDFYQIGITTPLFGEEISPEQEQRAKVRWFKLQDSAARHELRERVKAYHHALFVGDAQQRYHLAHEIVQDTKAHHGALIGLGVNTTEVWRAIHHDAQRYERFEYFHRLDLVERVGFRAVEQYVEAKQAHALAWRELFESKATAKFDEKTFYSMANRYVHCYTQERNRLATDIVQNPSLHQAGLEYFKLNPDELKPQDYAHRCRLDVEQYLAQTNCLEQSKTALAIIADPKSHHSIVIEKGLSWNIIYRDAKRAERLQRFAQLSLEEKFLIRLTDRYAEAKQKAGTLYTTLKTQSSHLVSSERHSKRADHAFAQRDYLAWRLVDLSYSINSQALADLAKAQHLKLPALLQQHAQHMERLKVIEQWQSIYQEAVETTQMLYSDLSKTGQAEPSFVEKALTSVHTAEAFYKAARLERPEYFHYALITYGFSEKAMTEQITGLTELKTQLHSLALLKNIDQQYDKQRIAQRLHDAVRTPVTERIDLKGLRETLNQQAEAVAQHYLGNPKTRSGNTWRYGSHQGSLVVSVRGPKQGLWRDFQTGEGGDLLTLIQHATGLVNFKDVLQEATRFVGGYSFIETPTQITKTERKQVVGLDAYTVQKIKAAQSIYNGTQSIEGTLAERYLREHRGIHSPLYDKTFRYHPHLKNWMTGDVYPALIVTARDDHHEVCGIQAIFLDPVTAKKASMGHHAKLSRGMIGEGALVHPGIPGSKIAVAEGPETALSVAEAHPDWSVYVSFGVSNFDKTVHRIKAKSIVICADNDGVNSGTAKSVERAAQTLSEHGIEVWVAQPQKPEEQLKWDFNDALLQAGKEQVKLDLDKAVLLKKGLTQDSVTQALKETVSTLSQHIQDVLPAVVNQQTSSELSTQSLETLLTHYVAMEIKQTQLVSTLHSTRLKDAKAARELSQEVIAHSHSIKAFAAEAIQHPQIKTEMEALKTQRPATLSQRGGFIAINERIAKGEWLKEDVQTLLVQLRGKSAEQSRDRSEDRNRGGRTQ